MLAIEQQRSKKNGVLLATGGLLLAVVVTFGLNFFGMETLTVSQWLLAIGVTLVIQALLWLVLHLGWDTHLPWDRHYLFLPMFAAAVLLNFYIYLAPPVRLVLLMAWFSSLVYMAGLVGFLGVVVISAVMSLGYIVTMALLIARGEPLYLPLEATVAAVFLIINVYAGVVFERLLREREETKALRKNLAELAITDSLTGLFNRRHFEEILRDEVTRIQRYGGQVALAMLDLDFFKNYNDTLGHLAGDELLKDLSRMLRRHIRATDVLARYGGEEFGLIMVNTSKDEAVAAMERLRGLIEAYPFRGGSIQPLGRLTISIGIAGVPDDGTEFEEMVRRADAALYAAKRLGRNQVQPAAIA